MGSFVVARHTADGNLAFHNVTMSKLTTTFNSPESPIARGAYNGSAGAATTIITSSVSQIAFISGSPSVVPTAHNVSFRGTPLPSILLSSHRVNAGIAIVPSQPNPSRTDPALSSSFQGTANISTTPTLTGANMSAHSNIEPPEDMLNPLQIGAIIGGSVSVTTIILIAIAVFLILRRRRGSRCAMERTTRLSSEKKSKIGKSSRMSPSGPARSSRYPTRTIDSHIPSVSTHIEQHKPIPHPNFAPFNKMKSHTVRRLRTSSLPSHSRQLRDHAWHSIPSPNMGESATRDSHRLAPTGFPDPFLDPPRVSAPEISLRCPTTPGYAFHQNSPKTTRRSMNISSMLATNGGTQNLMPSQPSPVPLSICFRQPIAHTPALHLRRPDVRGPSPPQRNNSTASQVETNSASSGSVIILPGRTSEGSSGIFQASASDISYWRSNRSPQRSGLDTRKSDPFDLERPDSSSADDVNISEHVDTQNPRSPQQLIS
ncbi:hypothetical protein GX51_00942 [Blastomyces parvus]|uniref:Uncharacterized protein n=1 Tax=Blastomyces parvus TaxID=2060905 RepID=A0A2B7XIX4_9EURO|nr:hypothetical protein GX51_00942 [Blastomyces parvus]